MSYTSAHQQVARKERRAYMWSGELPPRNYSHPVFSCKIFVGGGNFLVYFRHIYSRVSVPWDVSEDALLEAFSPYGRCKVEWPGNEARFARPGQRGGTITRGKVGYLFFSSILFYFFQVTGYVYMIFDHEHSVRHLLRDCSQVVVSHFRTIQIHHLVPGVWLCRRVVLPSQGQEKQYDRNSTSSGGQKHLHRSTGREQTMPKYYIA